MRGSVLALAAAVLIGGCSSSTPTSAPVTAPAATSQTPAITSTSAATTATSPRTGGPLTTVGPGTYEVGTGNGQIAPGKYFAPAPSNGSTCYYARLRNNDSAAGDIIAEELSQNQIIMTVRASDGYVTVSGCTFLAAS
jgi:ABC-type transport system substrate-binding protein